MNRKKILGFTLVEILVALAISTGIIVGAVQIYFMQTYFALRARAMTELQDESYILAEIITRDFKSASLVTTTATGFQLDLYRDDETIGGTSIQRVIYSVNAAGGITRTRSYPTNTTPGSASNTWCRNYTTTMTIKQYPNSVVPTNFSPNIGGWYINITFGRTNGLLTTAGYGKVGGTNVTNVKSSLNLYFSNGAPVPTLTLP